MSGQQGPRPGQDQPSYQQGRSPQPGQPGRRPPRATPTKKSPWLLIGIVVAAVVALVAIGGIVIGLTVGGPDVPTTTLRPTLQAPPSDEPSDEASDGPSSSSSPGSDPSGAPAPSGEDRSAIDLGHDVTLKPASGWDVRRQTASLAQLTDGTNVFIGQTAELDDQTNPGQACTAWHKQLAGDGGGGTFSEPEAAEVGSDDLVASTCSARITASSGQGSSTLLLVSVVSVRSSDGVTVLGTAAFPASADEDRLTRDFATMSSSMLTSQAAGG